MTPGFMLQHAGPRTAKQQTKPAPKIRPQPNEHTGSRAHRHMVTPAHVLNSSRCQRAAAHRTSKRRCRACSWPQDGWTHVNGSPCWLAFFQYRVGCRMTACTPSGHDGRWGRAGYADEGHSHASRQLRRPLAAAAAASSFEREQAQAAILGASLSTYGQRYLDERGDRTQGDILGFAEALHRGPYTRTPRPTPPCCAVSQHTVPLERGGACRSLPRRGRVLPSSVRIWSDSATRCADYHRNVR